MRIPRFIVNFDPSQNEVWVEETGDVHRIKDVLRLKVGDMVILGDGKGNQREGQIFAVEPKRVGVALGQAVIGGEPLRRVTLYAALIKHKHFDMVVEKATEVGVSEIVPLITNRTIKLGLPRMRLEKIITEAAEQSGRMVLPELAEPVTFSEIVKKACAENDACFFFDLCDTSVRANDFNNISKKVAVFIGPEGGWTPEERVLAEEAGCTVRSLGPTTLRAETAAIVASYMMCNF